MLLLLPARWRYPAGHRYNPAMVRKVLSLLLILSVFWQSVAIAGVCATAATEEVAHAVLHWQDSDHHHHDDGSLHVDDSSGTIQHMHADSTNNIPGLLTAGWDTVPAIRSAGPAALAELPFPSPLLQGLLRPPRTIA
jgi:hypothetical protein